MRPKYRRQELGRLIIDWGIQKSDERGLEIYMDALPLGALLYEKYDFLTCGWVHFEAPENLEPSPKWNELKEQSLPLEFLPHWRPVGGILGKDTKKSWDNAGQSNAAYLTLI